jgi:hypothetical protein
MKINIDTEDAIALNRGPDVSFAVDPVSGEVNASSNFDKCGGLGYYVNGHGALRLALPSGSDEPVDGDDVPEHCRAAVAWILEVANG